LELRLSRFNRQLINSTQLIHYQSSRHRDDIKKTALWRHERWKSQFLPISSCDLCISANERIRTSGYTTTLLPNITAPTFPTRCGAWVRLSCIYLFESWNFKGRDLGNKGYEGEEEGTDYGKFHFVVVLLIIMMMRSESRTLCRRVDIPEDGVWSIVIPFLWVNMMWIDHGAFFPSRELEGYTNPPFQLLKNTIKVLITTP
jgi:hypothetical protein